MEIGRLALHPFDKGAKLVILQQPVTVCTKPCQLSIGEVLVDCTVADRVERNSLSPLLRLRNQMVKLLARAKAPLAQPAAFLCGL